jgi:regulatory protein
MNKLLYEKIKNYCKYSERCHSQVRYKLVELGARGLELEEIIATLIQENILNEERFAQLFANGKFRILHWGKVKISMELNTLQVSNYCINKALQQLDETEYQLSFKKQFDKKWISLKSEKNIFTKKTKTKNYLLQKGYEIKLIMTALNNF